MMIISFVSAFVLIAIAVWIIVKKKNCKTEIQATFLGNNKMTINSVTSYIPIFRYEFQSQIYEGRTFDAVSKRKIKNLVPGQEYSILINERKPKDFVLDDKMRVGDICLIGFGLFFLFAFLCMLMLEL